MLPGRVAWMCVQLGWRVVPAAAGAKRPALADWPNVASNDPDVVGAWWGGQYAESNVCVVTGRGSGFWALDIDERTGGYAVLALLEAEHGPLPTTFTVSTPSGGQHRYFAYPPEEWGEVKTGSNVVGPGVDVRGLGGQVMAPGCLAGGGVYQVVTGDTVDIAEAPSWLLALVRRSDPWDGTGWDGQAREGIGVQAMLAAAGRVPAGEQEQALFTFLCSLRAQGWDQQAMCVAGWQYASAFANVAGHPAGDWTAAHVTAKVEHVVRMYPPGTGIEVPAAGAAWLTARAEPPSQPAAAQTAERTRDLSDELTGTGNAHRFIGRYGRHARYVAGVGWHLWDGGVWRADHTQLALHWTEQIGEDVKAQWHRELDFEVSKVRARDLAGHYNRTSSIRGRQEMLALAASAPSMALTAQDLDADRWVLRVANGTLDLRTGRLRASVREDYHTQQAEVSYDPDAQCPNFQRLVNHALPDPAVAAYVQRMFGYCLTGDVGAQAFFFFEGKSGAGKSTLCDLLRMMLGGYGAVADENLLYKTDEHSTGLMDLLGKRLVVQDELSKTKRLDTARINRMTGFPLIRARPMRGNFVDIPVQFKLMMSANNLPGMGGSGVDGIWRRMKLVMFDHVIPGDPIPGYAQILLDTEGPGFLNWCLAGLADYRERGLFDPSSVRQAVADYRAQEDVMGQFVDEYVVKDDGVAWLANADLMAVYLAWCKANGHRPEDGRIVGKWLKQAGYMASRPLKAKRIGMDGGTEARLHRGWTGVRLDVERAGGFLVERLWEPVTSPHAA